MTRLTPGSDTSPALGKAFKPHGFHDACDLLVIDRAEIRITVEARSDAFSTIKPCSSSKVVLIFAPIRASEHIFNLRFFGGVDPLVERGAIEL
nr:hypothetical protein [Corynebacterium urealyticum]